jgi:hypothetical protein
MLLGTPDVSKELSRENPAETESPNVTPSNDVLAIADVFNAPDIKSELFVSPTGLDRIDLIVE